MDSKKKSTPATIPPERATFARNLRQARLDAGLSQEDVRAKCGCSQRFISETENGLCSPTLDTAARLARGVGRPLWKLLRP